MINSSIRNKISRFNLEPKKRPQRCPSRLPQTFLDREISLKFKSQIKSAVQKCYEARTFPTRVCKTKISTIRNRDSAIGLHLLQNDECAKFYNDQQFSILAKARTSFHLAALEATYIKIHQPVFFRQKEFVYVLQIPH